MARAPKARFGNFTDVPGVGGGIMSQGAFVARSLDFGFDWKMLAEFRARWKRKLIVKGIVHPEDAARAAGAGADAIVVSNHGGRQLDGDTSTIAALPRVVEAVAARHADKVDVLFDSGIRRGMDVVKALALGAKGCLVGRAFLYGLAAAGEKGVAQALAILREEIDNTLAHVGVMDLREIAKRREEFLTSV